MRYYELMEDFDFSFGKGIKEVKIGDTTITYSMNDDKTINLGSIRTPISKRKKGSARIALQAFCDAADKKGLTIVLGASPLDSKTRLDKLVLFYKSFGFELTGNKINFAGDPEMIRKPK